MARAPDAIMTFNGEGLRWAFQVLSTRTEVGAVMEEMLGTIEHWKLANDIGHYKFKLEQEQEEVRRLEGLVGELRQAREEQEREAQRVREAATGLRDKLVEEMMELSRGLREKEVLERRLGESRRALERLPLLEKELHKAQRDLQDAQRRLTHTQPYAPGGRASPAPAPALLNGHPQGGRGPPALTNSPRRPHGFFTTFTTLEEKLLLRVFSYLTAADVLATAEVCRPFYDRVGLIFGKPSPGVGGSSTTTGPSTAPPTPQPQAAGGEAAPRSRASSAARAILEDKAPPLSDKLASSIASKLTGPELKGIIAMTEKLRRVEAVLAQLQAENEDVRARLQGTESVKDFLVGKLKDTEVVLKKTLEGQGSAARQRASDQEVISFLDGRVQELEATLQQTVGRLAELQEQHKKDRLMAQEQVRVLKDMADFEKQKGEEAEGQFRTQKKLLAREIKTLRSEVQARTAERDMYREELRNLRQTVSQYRR